MCLGKAGDHGKAKTRQGRFFYECPSRIHQCVLVIEWVLFEYALPFCHPLQGEWENDLVGGTFTGHPVQGVPMVHKFPMTYQVRSVLSVLTPVFMGPFD